MPLRQILTRVPTARDPYRQNLQERHSQFLEGVIVEEGDDSGEAQMVDDSDNDAAVGE
jgi:hypothetical protein